MPPKARAKSTAVTISVPRLPTYKQNDLSKLSDNGLAKRGAAYINVVNKADDALLKIDTLRGALTNVRSAADERYQHVYQEANFRDTEYESGIGRRATRERNAEVRASKRVGKTSGREMLEAFE